MCHTAGRKDHAEEEFQRDRDGDRSLCAIRTYSPDTIEPADKARCLSGLWARNRDGSVFLEEIGTIWRGRDQETETEPEVVFEVVLESFFSRGS